MKAAVKYILSCILCLWLICISFISPTGAGFGRVEMKFILHDGKRSSNDEIVEVLVRERHWEGEPPIGIDRKDDHNELEDEFIALCTYHSVQFHRSEDGTVEFNHDVHFAINETLAFTSRCLVPGDLSIKVVRASGETEEILVEKVVGHRFDPITNHYEIHVLLK